MMPVMAGPPYAVAPSLRKLLAISCQCLAKAPRCMLGIFASLYTKMQWPRRSFTASTKPRPQAGATWRRWLRRVVPASPLRRPADHLLSPSRGRSDTPIGYGNGMSQDLADTGALHTSGAESGARTQTAQRPGTTGRQCLSHGHGP